MAADEAAMNDASSLGGYLREERERAGLSQRQLASRVGIHNSYLARLESGETAHPSPDVVQRIADVLEIDPTDLYAYIGVVPPSGLPEFAPYLRAKYHMNDSAIREMAEHLWKLGGDTNTK
jgi:transcriptional regulator with XRE-family HTH domain